MSDNNDYAAEHMLLFGHAPITDLSNGAKCLHPMHDALNAMMDAPGVDLEIEFVPQEIIGDDDPMVIADREDYERTVQEYRDAIQKIEEEDEWLKQGKKQF